MNQQEQELNEYRSNIYENRVDKQKWEEVLGIIVTLRADNDGLRNTNS